MTQGRNRLVMKTSDCVFSFQFCVTLKQSGMQRSFVDAGYHHPGNCMISYARHTPIPQAPVPGVPPFCSGEKEEECGSPAEA